MWLPRLRPRDTASRGTRAGISNGYIHNNIEYDSWGDSATSGLEVYYVEGGLTADYNLAYDPSGTVTFAPVWTSQANSDPTSIRPLSITPATTSRSDPRLGRSPRRGH